MMKDKVTHATIPLNDFEAEILIKCIQTAEYYGKIPPIYSQAINEIIKKLESAFKIPQH